MKQRIISSILGLGVLAVVLYAYDTVVLNLAVAVICMMAVYEFLHATGICKNRLLSAAAYLATIGVPFIPVQREMDLLPVFLLPYLFVLFCILLLTHDTTGFDQVAMVFAITLGIPLSLSSAVYIRDNHDLITGIFYLLLALAGAWLSDSGAYFVGCAFGKHKLCPRISPKKTVEGLVGGLVTCTVLFGVLGALFAWVCGQMGVQVVIHYPLLLAVAPVASLMSVLGDLSASVIKRQYGVKDFGNIMPGHGGVLDRFDSVLFVAPFIYVVTKYLPLCTLA